MLLDTCLARTHRFDCHIYDQNSRRQSIFSKIALIIYLIGFSANLCAATYEESVAKIRQNQASVKDYLLVCQVCSDEFGGGYEKGFRFRDSIFSNVNKMKHHSPPASGSADEKALSATVFVDTKNGFARLYIPVLDFEGGSHILTMALFVMRDKTKTIAISEFHGGLDSDIYSYHFYKVESDKWINVTNYVLEQIPLAGFAEDTHTKKALTSVVNWELHLPRFGTTGLLQPHLAYGLPTEEYPRLKIRTGAMELLWDPYNGQFIKGNMVDPARWAARYTK
jgi:hypothetical protein